MPLQLEQPVFPTKGIVCALIGFSGVTIRIRMVNSESVTNDMDDLNAERVRDLIINEYVGNLSPQSLLSFREHVEDAHRAYFNVELLLDGTT